MERKLASVQRITAITAIEGADRIVTADLLGWHCVTQVSNGFKPGDLVVYFEIDSLLPLSNPAFDFLKDHNKPAATHHRLKTKRFKKQIAQGLILPLHAVKVGEKILHRKDEPFYHDEYVNPADFQIDVEEGTDLTEMLGIEKYEPEMPAQLRGISKGSFPYFLVKTDETRIQAAPNLLVNRKGERVYATEKIDGSSHTSWFYPNEKAVELGLPIAPEDHDRGYTFGVASRNLNLARSEDNAFWKTADKYELEKRLKDYGRALAVQGEMFGPGIQDNKLKRPTVDLNVFNIYDLTTKQFLDREDFNKVVTDLGLTPVPTVYEDFILDHTVDQLVTMAQIKSSYNKDVWAEGIVIRPYKESIEHRFGRFSFKVINLEFLLKHGE